MACNQYRVQHRIEEQDVVRMQSGAKRQGRGLALPIDHLGLVDQVGGQDDDNQDEDPLDLDTVRVKWWRGVMESYLGNAKIDQLSLVDRSFGPGDIVSRYSDNGAQMGAVHGMQLSVHAYFPKTKRSLAAVNARDFAPLHAFRPQPAIVDLRPEEDVLLEETAAYIAVGHIVGCHWDLIVLFKDGSRCVVAGAQPEELVPDEIIDALDDSAPFWPGQAVGDPRNRIFRHCEYLSGSWKKSHVVQGGVVQYIIPTRVQVHLLTCTKPIGELLHLQGSQPTAGGASSNTATEDEDIVCWVHPSKLIVFHTFAHCELRLADLAMYAPIDASQSRGPLSTSTPAYSVRFYGPKFRPGVEADIVAPQECAQYYRQQLEGLGENPSDIPFEEEVAWVVDLRTIIDVRWQDGRLEEGIPSTELYSRNYVQEFDAFPGDLVRYAPGGQVDPAQDRRGVVQRMDAAQRLVWVRWQAGAAGLGPEEEVSGYDLLPAVKEDMMVGDLVLRIPPALNQRTRAAFHPELDSDRPQAVCLPLYLADLHRPGDMGAVPGQLVATSLVGQVTVLWADGTQQLLDWLEVVALPDLAAEDDGGDSDEWDSDSSEETAAPEDAEEVTEGNLSCALDTVRLLNGCPAQSSPAPSPHSLPSRFELLEEPFATHHFRDQACGHRVRKALLKRLREEWALLQEGLPACGVRVKASATHLQLMKVLIAGATHTPYVHAVFGFDVFIPDEFPDVPPEMHFHSYGVRLNPNLSHKDGTLCLSLLNTWHSPYKQEMWSPGSSLLQVLLSLQSLVLCSEPYYNEGAYDKHVGAERNSRSYNEQIVLNKVRYLLALFDRPIPDWEEEVRSYLRLSMPDALQSLQAYLSYGERGDAAGAAPCCDAEGLFPPPSGGFRHTLHRTLPDLEAVCASLP